VKLRENIKTWKNYKTSLNNAWVLIFTFQGKSMFKGDSVKTKQRVLRKNKLDTDGAPVFASHNSAKVLAAKMCTNSNEHCIYIRFLCFNQEHSMYIRFLYFNHEHSLYIRFLCFNHEHSMYIRFLCFNHRVEVLSVKAYLHVQFQSAISQ
jgi:hypothetical protein